MTIKKSFRPTAIASGLGAIILGATSCSPVFAADKADSDFVKMLQDNNRDVSWSDYKSDGKGGEVFKDLVIKAPNAELKAEEADFSNFKANSTGKSGSADHVLFKNVSIKTSKPLMSAGITSMKMQEMDVPKFHYQDKSADLKMVFKNAEIQAISAGMIPSLETGETTGSGKPITYKIDQAVYDFSYDYAQNDLKADLTFLVKDDTNMHVNFNLGGLNKLVDMQDKMKDSGKQLDPKTMGMMFMAEGTIKSLDIEAENLKASKKSSISYKEDYNQCRELELSKVVSSTDICTPLTRYKRDMERTLKISLHPDQPVSVMDLVITGKTGGPDAVGQILKTLNFSMTN